MEARLAQRSEARELRFSFGGVAFDVYLDDSVPWDPPALLQSFCGDFAEGPVAGLVALSVHAARGSTAAGRPTGRAVDWAWDESDGWTRTDATRARLRRVADDRFAVTATTTGAPQSVEGLLTSVGAAVIHRRGGLLLHAAAVRLDDRVVLFVGPSGAGKSTAAEQTAGGVVVGYDRAAVFPCRGRWYGVGLPGGTAGARPARPARPLPLGGVFRVVQGHAASSEALAEVHAIKAVRESTLASPSGCEASVLDRVHALCRATPVHQLTTVLGVDVSLAVRALRADEPC